MGASSDEDVIVTFSKGWAIGASVVLAAFSLLAFKMALAMTALVGRLGLAAFGALMGWAAIRQANFIRSPLVLFSATREGITTYLDAPRYTRAGFTVPWSSVRAIELVTRNVLPDHRRFVTIAIEVAPGRSIPRAVSYGATEDESNVLHLDATTGNLRGEQLLEAIGRVWRRFGG